MPDKNPIAPTQSLLLIGRIGKTHGIRGEVKVIPETDDPTRFGDLDTLYVGSSPERARSAEVESVRFQQGKRGVTVVLKIAGVDQVDDASTLRKLLVYADEADLPPLDEDEFFLHDLIGLRVVTNDAVPVGTVKEVLELQSHPVYVVARPGQSDAMIPGVPAFIADVDVEENKLVVLPIEGLLD